MGLGFRHGRHPGARSPAQPAGPAEDRVRGPSGAARQETLAYSVAARLRLHAPGLEAKEGSSLLRQRCRRGFPSGSRRGKGGRPALRPAWFGRSTSRDWLDERLLEHSGGRGRCRLSCSRARRLPEIGGSKRLGLSRGRRRRTACTCPPACRRDTGFRRPRLLALLGDLVGISDLGWRLPASMLSDSGGGPRCRPMAAARPRLSRRTQGHWEAAVATAPSERGPIPGAWTPKTD